MAFSTRTIRIIAASVLSVVLVFGAYVFTGGIPFLTSKFANAQSTDQLLKAYAAKDSDNDGLPDWQEALYGTDPNNPHSVDPTLTDGEALAKGMLTPHTSAAVPGIVVATTSVASDDIPGVDPTPDSVTDQFGQEFLQDYMAESNGQDLTDDQQQALITQLMASYSQKASALLVSKYTLLSIHVSPETTTDIYAASVMQVIEDNDIPASTGQPILLMQAFLQNNDTSAQKQLGVIANAYGAIAQGLLQVPVPPALASQHLALVQSFDTLAHATKAVTNYQNDPMAVLGSLSVIPDASGTLATTFQSLGQAIIADGGEPAPGTASAALVGIARSTVPTQP